ncbi:MAG: alpha/beta hydrolase [Acidimicrobiia bacterium]|jgi:pimeloyl-ACP methyl ester carboxylesterase
MPVATVDGIELAHEVIGDTGDPWILTPGGRFGKDTPGLRELAQAIAADGHRVLIWDRPNTGASSVCFTGATESDMQADALAGLLRSLDMAPATIFGGSGGARVSLLAATNHPDIASRLAMVWVSGGVYGLLALGVHYCGDSIRIAWRGGMEAVVEMPEWAEVLERNPGNRERFLALDRDEFIATMERWMLAYCPTPDSTVPGISDARLGSLTQSVPTLIFRSGASDAHHTRATSERLHQVIAGSELVEPPWGDTEWNDRSDDFLAGTATGLFVRWPLLAPTLLDFARR